jgi:signal transduction histidine kinase/energy-coupling factor transporter ATP-binding protein EcfA2
VLPPEKVEIRFRANGVKQEALVLNESWSPFAAADVAILSLIGNIPGGVETLPLGASIEVEGHEFKTFGFPPQVDPINGLDGSGTIVGRTDRQGIPVLQIRSNEVTSGFSGAPVWDKQRRRVIGMVTSFIKPDKWDRLSDTAFIIPTETLLNILPKLQLSEICPYKGLLAFAEGDADFFFGRQKFLKRLVGSLRQNPRFLAVLGPSGSGKSSLVQAGLIPQLQKGDVPDSDQWGVILTRPANNPFDQLAGKGLDGAFEGLTEGVHCWLNRHNTKTRLVLIIDQFEELLVTCSEPVCQAFVVQLNSLLNSALDITVILIMRDDFYSHFTKKASPLLEIFEKNLVNIPPMLNKDELIAIICEPVRVAGWGFEDGLVDIIVKDSMDTILREDGEQVCRSTTLPLLEFSLSELWKRRKDGRLTHKGYRDIGGVTGGLAQWADRAFYRLGEGQRPLARRILSGLVHIGDESQGIPDSRRRRAMVDFCKDESKCNDVKLVVQHLAAPEARLLVTGFDIRTGQETIEIIHDALLREWKIFRQWLEDDRRFLTWHEELERKVETWVNTAPDDQTLRDNDLLLNGRNLIEALEYKHDRNEDLTVEESDYIRQSEQQREEDERQRQIAQAHEQMIRVLTVLQEISRALLTTVKEERMHDIILQGLTLDQGLGFDRALILTVDELTKTLSGAKGAERTAQLEQLPLHEALMLAPPTKVQVSDWQVLLEPGHSALADAILKMKPIYIHYPSQESESFIGSPSKFDAQEIFIVPLVVKDRPTGAIVVDNHTSNRSLEDVERAGLEMFASQAALLLENAHLYYTIEANNRELLLIRERMLESDRLAALSSLASGMAHEIRNPLVSIGGFARRIAKMVEVNSPIRGYVEVIQEEVTRLEKLLREILDFTGENLSNYGNHDLGKLIDDTLVLVERDLDAANIKVVKEYAQMSRLHCDDRQIKQVFYNLFQNGIQAMSQGGELTIRTYPVERPDGLYEGVAISDTGGGIRLDVLHNIFNPFFSTKDYGTGLGLAIAQRIVSRHYGEIEVSNEIGRGVTFIMTLPLAKYCLVKEAGQEAAPISVLKTPKGGCLKKILVADDEMSIRDLYSEELKEEGYEVYLASNGREALEIIDTVALDLVILDTRMPEMGGIEVLQHITEKRPELPVVLSAEHESSFAKPLKGECIVKSSDLDELKALIKQYLEN